ncbi:MAG TPA: hypothetical protein VJ385_19380 [Fibrobacteria bacterium]|nr:hypothetical protein [Fibrobacteria bacterium]
MVLASLGLGACSSPDEPEYDVPERSRILGAQLEVDADGTPVVIAQVGMNYGTQAPRGEWDPAYVTRNVETVVYAGTGGAWKAHPFRNLQRSYEGRPLLVRNAAGRLQPLVWNRQRLSLYARSGDDWILKSTSLVDDPYRMHDFGAPYQNGYGNVSLLGDSGWQAMAPFQERPAAVVMTSDGRRFVLDTMVQFNPMGFFYGKTANLAVGTLNQYSYSSTGPNPSLVCYSWDPDHPASKPVRNTLLDSGDAYSLPAGYSLSAGKVLGEDRIYVYTRSDSLAEFALRGDGFVRLSGIDLRVPVPGKDSLSGSRVLVRPSIGPDRCVHTLGALESRASSQYMPTSPISFLHTSSCLTGKDTLALPEQLRVQDAYTTLSEMRFSPQGEPMVLLTTVKSPPQFHGGDVSIGPSWIVLARRTETGKWEIEKIAEY